MVLHIPYPKVKNQLVSMNLWNRLHWNKRKEIKQELKAMLKDWFVEQRSEPMNAIEFTFRFHRKGNRKFDSINSAPICKVVEDVFTEQGWVKDDDKNRIILEPTVFGSDEDILEIIVKEI